MIVFAIIAVCFILSVMIGILLSRRISRSLAKLATEVDKVSRLDLDANAAIISIISEVVKINDSITNDYFLLQNLKYFSAIEKLWIIIWFQNDCRCCTAPGFLDTSYS